MPQTTADIALILVDHGSEQSAANDLLLEVADRVRESSGFAIVEPAHMDLAEPSIEQAFARCVRRGASFVVVHPYFLAPGRHSTKDIPRMAEEAAAKYPHVGYCITEPLGLDPRMIEIVMRRVHEALALQDAGTIRAAP